MVLAGVAVGHHHVRQRGAVQDRSDAPLVLVADVVDDEALPGCEADPQVPLLPGHPPAVDRKAGAFGLRDVEWPHVSAELAHELGSVVAVLGRQRHKAVIVDAHHFHAVQVDDGGDTLDGTGVAVIGGAGAQEAPGQDQAAPFLVGISVIPGGPGIDHYQAGVGDSPLGYGSQEFRIGPDHRFTLEEFVEHHPGLHARYVFPRDHPPLVEGHYCLIG